MHRIGGKAEWAFVPANKHNIWQKIAVRTHGILTVGNVFSLIGLLSVPLALVLILRDAQYIAGAVILLAGRACDVADGWLAHATGTKSPVGEKIDAIFDKISTATAIIGLTLSGIIPWWALGVLLVPHGIVAVMALWVFKKGKVLHPSLAGKLSMIPAWFSLVAFVLQQQFSQLAVMAISLVIISGLVSGYAIVGYTREFSRLT